MSSFPARENDLTKQTATIRLEHVFLSPTQTSGITGEAECHYCHVKRNGNLAQLTEQCPERDITAFKGIAEHRGGKLG